MGDVSVSVSPKKTPLTGTYSITLTAVHTSCTSIAEARPAEKTLPKEPTVKGKGATWTAGSMCISGKAYKVPQQ